MAEPHVPFALKLPIDLNQEIRDIATPLQINQTMIDLLREAIAARKERG